MERSPNDVELTTTEAAALLEVHPSTVKRWCNDGLMDVATTEGGHRRIRLDDVMAFSEAQHIRTVLSPFHPYEPHVWTALRAAEDEGTFRKVQVLAHGWALRGEARRLEQLYTALGRSPEVPFSTFCDEAVRGLMAAIGAAWADGRLRVGEEHVVSQVMIDVLLRLRTEWIDEREDESGHHDTGRVAIVGTLAGNQHYLGALCVRILLERLGWAVQYLGPDVPIDDFADVQRSRAARLVSISLGPNHSMADVARSLTLLGHAYDHSRPYRLVFGGTPRGAPSQPDQDVPFQSVAILESCAELVTYLDASTLHSVGAS